MKNLKIFNPDFTSGQYPIFFTLFFILCSLFLAVPVFATTVGSEGQVLSTPAEKVEKASSCTLEELQELKKSYDSKTQQEIKFEPSKILPLCVYFEGTSAEKTCGCRNINVLVSLLTKFATWLFGIVGAAALAVFIYGGFVILTAAGSAERVKKGKDILVAAIIGLVIVFTAQMGMRFLIKTVLTPTETEKAVVPAPATLEKDLFINMPPGK